MKNSKFIFLIVIVLSILVAGAVNFSSLKNSFSNLKKAQTALKVAATSGTIDPGDNPAFRALMTTRDNLALVTFEKNDLALFQKFFPIILEKRFGLSSVSLNITKQYSSLDNKKIFNAKLQFTGDYRQFLKAVNDNFPLVFVQQLEANGNAFSADIYGYVTDTAENFDYSEGIKAYSVFVQTGGITEKTGKVYEGALTFTKDGNIYFLKPMLEAKSYLVCKNAVVYMNKNVAGDNTFLILPIKDDLSIQE